jgi:uncharacterized protein YjbJ (UPF0337 family)
MKCNNVAGERKQHFTKLTDDDLLYKKGKKKGSSGKLQNKPGRTTKNNFKNVIGNLQKI